MVHSALSPDAFLPGLLLALAIGMLIGIERGWRLRDEESGDRVAGIRTFAMLGLLGGLAGIELPGSLGILPLLIVAGAIAALLLGYAADMRRDHHVSATSTIAAMLTIGLGAVASSGHLALASVGAGAAAILLASREVLHRAIRATSDVDMKALLRLVLVTFVILPLLPDARMGPFGALNPQRLWMVVVVTVGISFVGYALVRWLGQQKGALITGVVGALVSSTAVTVNSARRIREGDSPGPEEAAIALASVMMLGRALLLVSLLAPFALGRLATLIGPGAVIAIAAAAALVVRSRNAPTQGKGAAIKAPGLGLALLFALTVGVLAVGSAWAEARLGANGGAIVIALGGTADIDAAIAAVGALPPGSLPARSAALALAAPVLFNTLFKLALLVAIAGWRKPALGVLSLAAASVGIAVPIALALS